MCVYIYIYIYISISISIYIYLYLYIYIYIYIYIYLCVCLIECDKDIKIYWEKEREWLLTSVIKTNLKPYQSQNNSKIFKSNFLYMKLTESSNKLYQNADWLILDVFINLLSQILKCQILKYQWLNCQKL